MKVFTWNTQGERWTAIKRRIDKYNPDVFCIQEAGNLPKAIGYVGELTFGEPNDIGTYEGYKIWFLPWDRNEGNGNIRCSMAMLFQDGGVPAVSWSTDTYKRPVMRKSIGTKYYVANIHAGGQEYINQAILSAKTNAGNRTWIVAGDFNQNAKQNMPWLDRRGGTIIAPDKATRPASGKVLDYAISSDELGAASVDGEPDYGGSDHRSVDIDW
ncbi:endonuclease/exonuclease/phosphatase family protein [Methylomonas sp. AM2-LC]|uniref:endonuclease/exonuclease/phosphatase family protein n=1 Tax=Methylomonas sp. AM2-LC TaxID=3153301 RepID=UPI003264F1D1